MPSLRDIFEQRWGPAGGSQAVEMVGVGPPPQGVQDAFDESTRRDDAFDRQLLPMDTTIDALNQQREREEEEQRQAFRRRAPHALQIAQTEAESERAKLA